MSQKAAAPSRAGAQEGGTSPGKVLPADWDATTASFPAVLPSKTVASCPSYEDEIAARLLERALKLHL